MGAQSLARWFPFFQQSNKSHIFENNGFKIRKFPSFKIRNFLVLKICKFNLTQFNRFRLFKSQFCIYFLMDKDP